MIILYVIVALLLVVLAGVALSVRILKQYERAVIFRLGRVRDGERGPGLIVFVPVVDRVHRVSLRIVTMPIQSQGIITRDNVSVDVAAVAYYRVADAIRSVVAIENASAAINQIAQTTLRAVVGRHTLDETLSETETDSGRHRPTNWRWSSATPSTTSAPLWITRSSTPLTSTPVGSFRQRSRKSSCSRSSATGQRPTSVRKPSGSLQVSPRAFAMSSSASSRTDG
jgi:SPFH domain / Band 7 family